MLTTRASHGAGKGDGGMHPCTHQTWLKHPTLNLVLVSFVISQLIAHLKWATRNVWIKAMLKSLWGFIIDCQTECLQKICLQPLSRNATCTHEVWRTNDGGREPFIQVFSQMGHKERDVSLLGQAFALHHCKELNYTEVSPSMNLLSKFIFHFTF